MGKNFRPFIIDVEASGFGCASYPIEIGLALEKGKQDCSLILPAAAWTHWDKAAENTHHVTQKTLLCHGRPGDSINQTLLPNSRN